MSDSAPPKDFKLPEDFKPFEVNIDDVSRMTDVCLFVDRPRVVKYILGLRKILGVTKLRDPEDATDWKSWYRRRHKPTSPEEVKKLEEEADKLEADIEDFLASEGFSPAFVTVCIAAAISHKVTDVCYRRAYAEKELRPNPNFDPNWIIDGELVEEPMREHRMIVVVYPGATWIEVQKAYQKIIDGFTYSREKHASKSKITGFDHFFTFNLSQYGTAKGIHTKHQVAQARSWYWLHRKLHSCEKVRKAISDPKQQGELENIRLSVRTYRKLLGVRIAK